MITDTHNWSTLFILVRRDVLKTWRESADLLYPIMFFCSSNNTFSICVVPGNACSQIVRWRVTLDRRTSSYECIAGKLV